VISEGTRGIHPDPGLDRLSEILKLLKASFESNSSSVLMTRVFPDFS
jgi:hypothetical protein